MAVRVGLAVAKKIKKKSRKTDYNSGKVACYTHRTHQMCYMDKKREVMAS